MSGKLDSFFSKKGAKETPKGGEGEVMDEKPAVRVNPGPAKDAAKQPTASQTAGSLKSVQKKAEYKPFNVEVLLKEKYNPSKEAPFEKGQPAPFFLICDAFDVIAEIKGQNSVEKKKRIFINMFKTFHDLASNEMADFFFFVTGRLESEYLQGDLGVGDEIVMKACMDTTSCTRKDLKDQMEKVGDLGMVHQTRKGNTQTIKHFVVGKADTGRVTFEHVFSQIRLISLTAGSKEKQSILHMLLLDCTGNEGKYIIRFMQKGNFRIGGAKSITTSALARSLFEIYQPEDTTHDVLEKTLQKCSHQYPNYRYIINALVEGKADGQYLIDHCKLTPGIPCKPMLAKPTNNINVIFSRLDGKPFTCEYKYDGLRGQIHYTEGKVVIYSRNLENMTHTYPDVVQNILQAVKPGVKSFIVDSEIVGIDRETGRILSFQVLMSRNKKNVEIENIKNQVCVFLFDCIYLDGTILLDKTLQERKEHLRKAVGKVENKVDYVVSKEADEVDAIQEFLDESVKMGCEGLMVKTLVENSTYEPSTRSYKWLKLKRDYLDQALSDTLDLVVIGAKFGEGKRTGFYGTILVASYNPESEKYETTTMIGTGFTDEDLQVAYKKLKPLAMTEPHEDVHTKELTGNRKMDVWFKPELVVEVLATDIQISPTYTCGIGDVQPDKGLGLRFPRIIKIRDDKGVDDCTRSSQIVEMYKQQASVMNQLQAAMDEEEDDAY